MPSNLIQTNVDGLRLRFADERDVPVILRFIQDLADYERLSHECVATESALRDTLFGERRFAEVVLAHVDETPAAFALFFHSYSTFLAKPGIYLEDLFVKPEWRSRGIGRCLLAHLARLAIDRGCGRLEWAVLDWNAEAIRFYANLGAEPLDAWTTMRLAGDDLAALADEFAG